MDLAKKVTTEKICECSDGGNAEGWCDRGAWNTVR